MKASTIFSLLTLPIALSWSGCGSSSDPAPAPACKLKESLYTNPNTTNTTTYTYEGELLKTKVDSYVTTGAGASTVTNTSNYMYNTDGFVTSETLTSVTGSNPPTSTTNAYSYNANGKLTSVGSKTYQYDSGGNLTAIVAGTTTLRTYSAGVLTSIPPTSAYPVYTVVNGRITQIQSSATFRSEYGYDAQGRLSETKLYSGANLTRYTYEYETTVPPATSSVPAFKGAPTIPSEFGTPGYIKKETQYNGAGAVISTIDYVNNFKPNGYPNSIVRNTTNSGTNGNNTYSQGTVYSYIDCN